MADEAVVPSLSSTSTGVGARFITADDIQAARTRREEQWRAAYARSDLVQPPDRSPADAPLSGSARSRPRSNKKRLTMDGVLLRCAVITLCSSRS
ncbi:hypothetical protein K525DRAFT_259567 [Schizophyllum commune Loenen D]|nr:hypothetical protein K525DRAFT_259567 [Schizophyllum commune Loenen D]